MDPLGLFPASKMAQAIRLGQSRFYSIENAAPPVAPTTFSPSDLSNVTLSGGNLIATVLPTNGGVRGAGGLTSGKYYWENTYTTINTNTVGVGISLASASLTNATNIGFANIARTTGGITVNNVGSGSALGIINPAAVVGIAVDFTAKLIWFRIAPAGNWNGSGTANPATGVGGISIASISTGPLYPCMYGQTGDKITANFGATAFSGAVPSGFTSGWLV